ncbi:MAG: peptidylprolyl isomerase [Planctomycetes bacterium]|nr:peptidylprolyl isomerase [Planctomycetota bacterium]
MDSLLWHMETKSGAMDVEFWTDVAPATGLHIANLVARGYYDGLKFHRVMKGFMIQGGDPKGDGSGGPGYSIEAEFNSRKHEPGVLSMARIGDPRERLGARPEAKFANSGGSQFFLCHGDASFLDEKYTAYGKVVNGMDVVDKIATAPVGPNPMSGEPSMPVDPIKIDKATLVPGMRTVAESGAPAPSPEKKDGGR